MSVKVELDIARPRVTRTVLNVSADGRTWDKNTGLNTFVDPVSLTLMLRPQVLEAAYQTTFTGVYARLRRTDYRKADNSALPTADWAENPIKGTGDYYLESRVDTSGSTENYPVYTAVTHPANRAFYVSMFVPQGGGHDDDAIEFGWGTIGSTGSVSLRIRKGGQAEVWKRRSTDAAPVLVGTYSISGATEEAHYIDNKGVPTGDLAGRFVDLYIIPYRRRELLVFSSSGGGFTHTFDDLDPSALNTITPAAKAWWLVRKGKASVQVTPMQFPTTGYALAPYQMRMAPPVSGTFQLRAPYWDKPPTGSDTDVAFALMKDDGVTPYVPDGIISKVRVKATLTASGTLTSGYRTHTPFAYAVFFQMQPATGTTNATQTKDITSHVKSIRFAVGEGPGDVSATLNLMDTPALRTLVPGITTQANRPVRILVDGKPFIYGVTGEPDLQEVQTDVAGKYRPLTIPVSDEFVPRLGELIYEEPSAPMDSGALTPMIAELLGHGGVATSEMDLESIALTLDYSPEFATKGKWKFQPKQGDVPAKLIEKFLKDYAPTWFCGFYPTATGVKFRFKSEGATGLGAEPVQATLYTHRNHETGKKGKACRDFKERVLPPEVTRITVYGFDIATQTLFKSVWPSSLSSGVAPATEDPTTAPSARPAGWCGQIKPFILYDTRLTTAASVNAVRDQLAARLGSQLRVAEWKSALLKKTTGPDAGVPLWRGDRVYIFGQTAGDTFNTQNKGVYRILSFSGELKREGGTDVDHPWVWRDVSYVGKRVGTLGNT